MNKDVIYIEPEQDITDILANIKASKHKIIALVPPKKAGVLRSAVNFKLISKTARQNEKTVVLITMDQSLRRLASSVAMPVAKTLQSKPQLPEDDDAVEFGEEKDGDVIEDDAPIASAPARKVPVATAVKVVKKKPAEDVIEAEPEAEPSDKPQTKNEKNVAKMKGAKIPNIAKYRKFIIAGSIALVIIIIFSIWANVIAPAAKIAVKVHTTSQNFTEKVSFVTDESKSDPKNGVFFIEEKSVTKKAEADFKATGEVDKGTKASGTIVITRPKGEIITAENQNFSIPKGATFNIGGKSFVVSEGGSVNVTDLEKQAPNACGPFGMCRKLNESLSSGNIAVVAKENGEESNISAAASGITSSISIPDGYTVTSSAMTGGTSKKVKVVSKEDVEGASSGLTESAESEAQDELKDEFGKDYILLGSMEQSDPKIKTSPNLNEEVNDNVTPRITKEVKYTMHAVSRESVEKYIKAVVKANLGDDTQKIYSTGVDKAFFDAYKNSKDDNSAKLKATVKTGPRVTEQMVIEKSLGKKTGEVRSILKAINGVSDVDIDTSYFWVASIPDDINKVEVTVDVEK